MTDANSDAFAKPTPALLGNAGPTVRRGIATDQEAAPTSPQATPLGAYNLLNREDPAGTGFLHLIRAHHAIGQRNAEKLAVSMQALAAAKTPAEFVDLQRKLLAETMAAALSDGKTLAELTTKAFAAAFNPSRKKVGELRGGAKRQE